MQQSSFTQVPSPKVSGNILIVDDESELTAALSEMLARTGYHTVGFTDGWSALAALNQESFDVLLVDLMMPEIDGLTVLKKALEIDPNLIGIIMTGQGTVQTAVEAMKSGAFDYILKPFKMNTVLVALARSLEVRHLRVDNFQLHEMLTIYELGQVVAYTLDIEVISRKTAQAALQQCQADEVSILLPLQDEDELVLVSAYGDQRDRLVGQRVPIEGTIAGWVARHHQPLTLEGEVHDSRFTSTHPRSDIRMATSLPMILGNKLVGVININMIHRQHTLTQAQLRALSILIGIAASAMENARLYEQTEKRLRRLSALRTIDQAITSSLDLRVTLNILLDQVSSELAVDGTAILLLDPQSQALQYAAGRGLRTDLLERSHILLGNGYAGMAAMERKTVMVPDLSAADPDPIRENLIHEESFQTCAFSPLITKGEVVGVLGVFQRSLFAPDAEWEEFLEAMAGQAAIAIDNARLFEHLQQLNQQLTLAYNATIEGWSHALDLRDRETEGHTQRVTEMSLRLARSMGGFDEDELVQIRRGALLHDIGKMGVPDGILLKSGELTPDEWKVMRKHPEYAYQLLFPINYLRKALDIPYYHHEQWDGSGYPAGLKGEQIPLAARIFSVVDVWDALRSDRPYRSGWSKEKVIDYLRERSGKQFDPQVVEVFLKIVTLPDMDS